jgi:hypothetical protein
MLRDGADAALSYVEAGLQPDLRAAGIRWRDSVRAAREFERRRPEACLEVRYEELVEEPEDRLKKVCEHLDLPFDAAMATRLDHAPDLGDLEEKEHLRRAAEPVTASRVGRARRSLADFDRRMLQDLIGPELKATGYDALT